MPLPSRNKDEDKNAFVSRCMSDDKMKSEYPDQKQRSAICIQRATADCGCLETADFMLQMETYGFEEEITEDNFYIPSEAEYVDFGEETEEWNCAKEKPGLWENIRKKKEREGKNYKPAKKGDPDRPDPEAWKKAQSGDGSEMAREQIQKMHDQLMDMISKLPMVEFEDWTKDMISKAEIYVQNVYDFVKYYEPGKYEDEEDEYSESEFKYQNPETGEVYTYRRKGYYKKDGNILRYVGKAAKYQGKTVTLNKPFRTANGPKKFSVYVKNEKGNVVKVNFGDPNMKIKKNIPERRKSFRARHNCDNPGPKWKARYWSCKAW
jgi:hypothetical protein